MNRDAGLSLNLLNWKGVALALIVYLLTNHIGATKKLHPIAFIALSALVGIVFKF